MGGYQKQKSVEVVGLFCLSLFIFTFGLSSQEIIGFDSRFYLFALEMWRHGFSLFPYSYHEPYPDYPATSTFLIYVFAKLLGGMNKFTAVLPSAMAASLTVVMTYLIGAIHHKRLGLYAVCFLFFAMAFLKSARSIALDMYPALITTCCFYLIYSADELRQSKRARWVYPLLFLGFLFRGPIGLVMPSGVVCIYYLLSKQIKKFFAAGLSAFLILIISMLLLLVLAYYEGGSVFVMDVMRMEVLGRMDHSYLPAYFYFTEGLLNYSLTFPAACLVLLGTGYYAVTAKQLTQDANFLLKLAGWMLVILIGMSIPGDKKIRYVLSMAPSIALIAAYLFVAPSALTYFTYLRAFMMRIFLFLPAIFLIAASGLVLYVKKNILPADMAYASFIAGMLMLQAMNLFAYYGFKNRINLQQAVVIALAAVSVVITNIAMVEPIELYIDKTHAFVAKVESARLEDHARLVFYNERPDGMPIKYLINMSQEAMPAFIHVPQDLLNDSGPTYFITSQSSFAALPSDITKSFHRVAEGNLGHVPVVAFTKT